MALDAVFPQKANPVVVNFSFDVPSDPAFGLQGFNDLKVTWIGVDYTLLLNPEVVVVVSNTQLQLNLGSVTNVGDFATYLHIEGTNDTYPVGNEYILSNRCLGNLHIPRICS